MLSAEFGVSGMKETSDERSDNAMGVVCVSLVPLLLGARMLLLAVIVAVPWEGAGGEESSCSTSSTYTFSPSRLS